MSANVVITGLGLSTHLGVGVESNWNAVTAESFVVPTASDSKKGYERAIELGLQASQEAFANAGFSSGEFESPERIGNTFSASKPLYANQSSGLRTQKEGNPEAFPWMAPDSVNHHLSQHFKIEGESRTVIAACATGAYAVALAAQWVEQGFCDVVLAGSVEAFPHPLMEAGFRQMGVLSREAAMRPFDRRRSGFVFGEGAGAIVIESRAHAEKRKAPVIAVLSGWALGADGHSSVAFNSNGRHIADVVKHSLKRARVEAGQVDYVNAHGTATKLNDWIETQALLAAFGESAKGVSVSATKSSTGHLLGAAGSVEMVLTCLALSRGVVPPTRHLEEADPECSLDYTPLAARRREMHHAMSLSFGFGGPIAALTVSRFS